MQISSNKINNCKIIDMNVNVSCKSKFKPVLY